MVSCYELLTGSCSALLGLSILLRLAWDSVFSGNVILLLVSIPKPQHTENKFLLHSFHFFRFPNSPAFQFFQTLSALPIERRDTSVFLLILILITEVLVRFLKRKQSGTFCGKGYRRNICNRLRVHSHNALQKKPWKHFKDKNAQEVMQGKNQEKGFCYSKPDCTRFTYLEMVLYL